MLIYLEKNVNPKKRITGDCSTRALVSCLKISYDEALKLQTEESLKCYYDPTSKQVMERVLKKFGYIKMKMPKKPNGKRYKVCELDEIIPTNIRNEGVLVTVANHHTCIRGCAIIDIWDCSFKSVCNYYIKCKEK